MTQLIKIFVSSAVSFFCYRYLPLAPDINSGLALFVFIAGLWLTEALPLSATAILIPVLATLLGIFNLKAALAHFAHPIIFTFLSGFALAAALREQQLDKAMATYLIRIAKGNFQLTSYLLFAATAILSMWISNMATAAVMLPLALGLLANVAPASRDKTAIFLLLGIAYCSSLGGIGTLVGSAPNGIAAAYAGLDFGYWMQRALPLIAILIPLTIFCLTIIHKPDLSRPVETSANSIQMNRQRWLTLLIFFTVISCWMFSSAISAMLGGIANIDTLIGIIGIVALCASRVVTWKMIEQQTDWGVLLLFGGGLCLSSVLKETGTAEFLAQGLSNLLQTASTITVVTLIVVFVIMLTEFASNTASAAILVPMLGALAETLGISVIAISMIIGVAASCAFMLPVSTPPNALVFGTGMIPLNKMMGTGIVLNVIAVCVISVFASLFW